MATISPSSSHTTSTPSVADLTKQLRLHEVAIAELNNQPSSRAVYQKNGNLFLRTTIQAATAMEQKQLESAKSKLKGQTRCRKRKSHRKSHSGEESIVTSHFVLKQQ